MKIGLTVWNHRIAPVFDTAREIYLAELIAGQQVAESTHSLTGDFPVQKILHLAEMGVETLICGAISRPVAAMVTGYGIRLIPYVSGNCEAVIRAWRLGTLESETYSMPGYGRRGRQPRSGRTIQNRRENNMNGRKSGGRRQGGGGGQGMGGGRGLGGGGRRPTSRPPGTTSATDGFCVCSQCGQRVPHELGQPCFKQKCPQCGASMNRE